LRTNAVPRLKIGIGRPRWGDPKEYVLTRFGKDQATELRLILDRAADAAETWLAEGLIAAMNGHNGAVTKERAG
jgi:PTH1 family peptidyl-tRNA hydrolase